MRVVPHVLDHFDLAVEYVEVSQGVLIEGYPQEHKQESPLDYRGWELVVPLHNEDEQVWEVDEEESEFLVLVIA